MTIETLRQRISRLGRKTLAFSKQLENHLGAIAYFIYHYNLSLLWEHYHKLDFISHSLLVPAERANIIIDF